MEDASVFHCQGYCAGPARLRLAGGPAPKSVAAYDRTCRSPAALIRQKGETFLAKSGTSAPDAPGL